MNKNKVIIRKLGNKDIKEVSNVIKTTLQPLFKSEQIPNKVIPKILKKWDPQEIANKVARNYYILAEDTLTKKVVGVAGLKKNNKEKIPNRLSMFFVLPKYQNLGIGKRFYDNIRNVAVEKGAKKLTISARPNSEAFYKKLGFKRIKIVWKEYENERRSHNVWMEQDI